MSSRSVSRSASPEANGRGSRSRSVSRSPSSASRGRDSRSRSYSRSPSRSPYSRSRSYSRSPSRRRSYSRTPPRRERYSAGENTTLFVGNLSDETDDRVLKSLCSRYGEVLETKLIAHPVTRRPRGYAFVKFAQVREAEDAAEALNGKANIAKYRPPSERPYRPRGGGGGGGGGYRRGGYREPRGGGGYYSPRPRSYYPPRYEESPPPYYRSRGRSSRYY